MKRIVYVLALVGIALVFAGCQDTANYHPQSAPANDFVTEDEPAAPEPTASEEINQLELSEMVVRITSQGNTASFQLYDTVAAQEFYEQLPMELELTNFRDAQWMFYPPDPLDVTDEEAYHDGIRGELSYYEPWGDVFMLYEDFHAGDEMHRLGIGIEGIENIAAMSGNASIEKEEPMDLIREGHERKMKIQIGDHTLTATLAENSSAEALMELLAEGPLTIDMEDYGGFEKVGPLGTSLPTNDEQMTTESGDIILYQGNKLVIYYAPNTWSFTRLGKIDDVTGLGEALGNGDVSITISIV